jgi:hypothetical protein
MDTGLRSADLSVPAGIEYIPAPPVTHAPDPRHAGLIKGCPVLFALVSTPCSLDPVLAEPADTHPGRQHRLRWPGDLYRSALPEAIWLEYVVLVELREGGGD